MTPHLSSHGSVLLTAIPTKPNQVIKVGTGTIAQSFGEGDVVGVGWHGKHCFACEACTAGDFVCCANQEVTGIHIGGGYQE